MADIVDVVAVGDVFIDRREPETAFQYVKDVFDRADIRIGNLEGPTSDEGERVPFVAPWLRTGPDAVGALEGVGFDAMSLANNHMMDYGAEALVDTLERLERAGIGVTGAGRTKTAAEQPVVIEENGIRIGLLGFDATPQSANFFAQAQADIPGTNMLDISPHYPETHVEGSDMEKMVRCVESAASQVDTLLVMFHFGIGATRTVPQQALARGAVEAGADCILGTNAHELQGVAVYQSVPILYGLGHFFWDPITDRYPNINPFPDETVLAELGVTADGVSTVTLRPGLLNEDDQPVLVEPGSDAFEQVAEKLTKLSEREGTTLERENDYLRVPL